MAVEKKDVSSKSFEKNKTGDQEFALPHGELNPAPEQAPVNENKEPGGSEAGDGIRDEKSESLVTAPSAEDNKPAHSVPYESAHQLEGREMSVVQPRK